MKAASLFNKYVFIGTNTRNQATFLAILAKYDAQQALAQVAHATHAKVSLEELTTALHNVVQKTMQRATFEVLLHPTYEGAQR